MPNRPPPEATHFEILPTGHMDKTVKFYQDDQVRGIWREWRDNAWHFCSAPPEFPNAMTTYAGALRDHQNGRLWHGAFRASADCWHVLDQKNLNGIKCRHCGAWFCL